MRAQGDPTTAAAPILPPRPNLGPEPLPEPTSLAGPIVVLALVAVSLGLATRWALRRRERRRRRPPTLVPRPAPAETSDLAPRERIIRLADLARAALVARFGPAWAAKTTEEIAAAAELAGRLGPERAERLVGLLHHADRVKFGDEPAETVQGDDWDDWVAAFVAEVGPDAGATSRING